MIMKKGPSLVVGGLPWWLATVLSVVLLLLLLQPTVVHAGVWGSLLPQSRADGHMTYLGHKV